MVHKFAFSRISTKVHDISEHYAIDGGGGGGRGKGVGKEKIYGETTLFKTQKCEIVYTV